MSCLWRSITSPNRGGLDVKSIDLDEITPNSFIINNPKVQPLLRGEGITVGHTFELVSTRRAGLIARLRTRGFNVRTLFSRLKHLPALPKPAEVGEIVQRDSTIKEHWSIFDADSLRWQKLPHQEIDGRLKISFPIGAIVRRRRSRAGGDFFLTTRTPQNQVALLSLDETNALLQAYAQATATSDIEVEAKAVDNGYELLIDYVLPHPHLDLLRAAGKRTDHGIHFEHAAWTIALATLHSLNLRPEVGDQVVKNPDIDPTFREDAEFE